MIQHTRRSVLLGVGGAAAATAGIGTLAAQPSYDGPDAVYTAIRSQPGMTLFMQGGEIRLVFADGAPGVDHERVLGWIRNAARSVTTYFGDFPVDRFGLLVVAEDSDRVGHATTYGYRGPVTRIHVGSRATQAAFDRDWVLVHEMTHTALPDLPRRALWLQEGNATWVEPIARAQAGLLPAADVWREAATGLPRGEPRPGEGGMDGTEAWYRLYWGGAGFWLLAEIAVFEQSEGKFLLRDALRAVNRQSGGNAVTWSPEQLMAVADKVTNTSALSDLYRRYTSASVTLDIGATFARLGVPRDGVPPFDDRAPLADLRRRITAA